MNTIVKKDFNYNFNNMLHKYSIEIDTDVFLPGADSLAYINNSDVCIAIIDIYDCKIVLKPIGSSYLVHSNTEEIYVDYIPQYLQPLLNKNAEFELNNLGIIIEERNHFEYLLYKKVNGLYREYPLEFHKPLNVLDSTLDSFIEELKTIAIFFIQGDYLDSMDDYYEEEGYLPPLASDDFESFCDNNDLNNNFN